VEDCAYAIGEEKFGGGGVWGEKGKIYKLTCDPDIRVKGREGEIELDSVSAADDVCDGGTELLVSSVVKAEPPLIHVVPVRRTTSLEGSGSFPLCLGKFCVYPSTIFSMASFGG